MQETAGDGVVRPTHATIHCSPKRAGWPLQAAARNFIVIVWVAPRLISVRVDVELQSAVQQPAKATLHA